MKNKLAIENIQGLIFGFAPKPVSCGRGVVIGAGQVFPEINFTLPPMSIDENTWPDVRKEYSSIIEEVCRRAVDLELNGLVVEFELLPPMTLHPVWGGEITEILTTTLNRFHQEYGLPSALRVTPTDVRDGVRPPLMRRGELLSKMLESFELCAQAGADLLAIESTGGKEVHDEALINGDLTGIVFALGVLGVSDMQFLWKNIVQICEKHKIVASGDTACGFANTAMVLAEKRMIPKTLAAVVRTASVARSLQAHLQGAIGPTKDCAYEGPYIKALTGVPISMEGKSSACAHLSSVGNVAAACCDLWSNESVQNVRLLSAFAPVVSMEHLIYDCRLFNTALKEGTASARQLQNWLVNSDVYYDPQAYVLKPEVVLSISEKLAGCGTPLKMTICAVRETLETLRIAYQHKNLKLNETELSWLDLLAMQLDTIPASEAELWAHIKSGPYAEKLVASEYELDQL